MGLDVSRLSSSGTLGEGEIAMLKASSQLSEEDIREMYDNFLKNGGSSGGTINREEFLHYYKKSVGSNDKDGILAENTFAAFDSNHDGFITFVEFVLALVEQNKTDLASVLDFSFKVMDTSGDGYVNFDELRTYIEKTTILTVGKEEASVIDQNNIATCVYEHLGLDVTEKINKQQFTDGCQKNKDLVKTFAPSK